MRDALGLPEFHVETLRTKDQTEAAVRAKRLNSKVEAHWRKLEATLANSTETPRQIQEAAEALLRRRGCRQVTPCVASGQTTSLRTSSLSVTGERSGRRLATETQATSTRIQTSTRTIASTTTQAC